MSSIHEKFMKEAIALSIKGMENNEGGPFGCVIVKDGEIIGRGNNKVTSTNDPTAHAEITAIRDACKNLNSFQLDGCIVYTSCEPCPMCFGALYWARPEKVFCGCSKDVAADAGFDDAFIYLELGQAPTDRTIPFEHICANEAAVAFARWKEKEDRTDY